MLKIILIGIVNDKKQIKQIYFQVAPSGFEPETKAPEASVLPLHHGAMIFILNVIQK